MWILLVFVSFVRQWSNIFSHLAPFFRGFLADTPQNNPRDVEYFPSAVQKGELNPGGFTWFAQGQEAFAPNSLLEVLDHISIIRAFPGGKSGLEAQGIPALCWGEKGADQLGPWGRWKCSFIPPVQFPVVVEEALCSWPGAPKNRRAHGLREQSYVNSTKPRELD